MVLPAEVVPDSSPGAWRVEKITEDGAVEVTIFSGPDAKRRAQQYATRQYGDVKE